MMLPKEGVLVREGDLLDVAASLLRSVDKEGLSVRDALRRALLRRAAQREPAEPDLDRERLLPCPFCGGDAAIVRAVEAGESARVVQCQTLGCEASSCVVYAIKEPATPKLLDAWNRRSPPALRDLVAERRRQVEEEGWTAEHDDVLQTDGQLALAAAAYAYVAARGPEHEDALSALDSALDESLLARTVQMLWPWSDDRWKPEEDRRRNLVKAGALILAEIERLDRTARRRREAAHDRDVQG